MIEFMDFITAGMLTLAAIALATILSIAAQ
jgi:hypothetical protein